MDLVLSTPKGTFLKTSLYILVVITILISLNILLLISLHSIDEKGVKILPLFYRRVLVIT
jgi:hypothetical protein